MKEQKFQLFRSEKSYSSKPNEAECRNMNFARERIIKLVVEGKKEPFKVSLNQIKSYLEKGYSINSSVMSDTMLLILDIDNGISEKEFVEICEKWDIIPNIYYRTFSYVKETNERFRAIYVLDKPYNLEQYKAIYQMLLFIFGELDTSSSNFKQLCHGTDKAVKLIHGKPLNVRELGKRTGYFEHLRQQKEKQEQEERERKSRQICYTDERTSEFLTVNGILEHFGINKTAFHFKDAYQIYKALVEFNLEDRLQLATEEKREEYFERFEKGYIKDSRVGSLENRDSDMAKKLWGALKSLHDKK